MKKGFTRIVGNIIYYIGKFIKYTGNKIVNIGTVITMIGTNMKFKKLAEMFENDFIFTKPMLRKGGCETQTGIFRRSDCVEK